ncbi:MAG: flagellar basal-body MS-ring/collar protein FliF [Candidatus Anammoxibacter sp.]
MNETLKMFIGQMRKLWKEMTFSAKFMAGSFLIGAIIAMVVWVNWIQTEEFGLLYSGQDTKAVGEVVNYLRDNDIAYQIKDRGLSVYVPTTRIYDAKLNLATEGLLQEEAGFEIFDQVKFGMTSFAQQVNYRRALQGELARTISELDPVRSANVQIVIPKRSLFIEEERKPKASIVLKLKSRRSLAQSQISGIVQLVAAAVEGLENKNVVITDNMGNLLTTKEQSTIISRSNERLELRKSLEDYYVLKATDIVSKILGSGKVVVKVSADMEYKNVDEKHVIYDPERNVPKSQRIVTRVSGGGSRGGGGSPGTDSNIRQVGLVQEIGSTEEEETIQTEYETSRVERLVSQHGGVLQRLSVAILVDGRYETEEGEDGESLRKYVPLPEATLLNIGSLVKNALGISDTRGDSLEVTNLQFTVEEIDVEDLVAERNPYVQMLMDNVSIIITIFTFIAFAFIVMKKMGARVQKQVSRIEAGLSLDEAKGLSKDQILADKLKEEGIVLGADGKPISATEKARLEEEVAEISAEHEYEGIKEGMIKSAAMKELLKKPGKELNKDLEVFKEQVRKVVKTKADGAANILKRWLAQ